MIQIGRERQAQGKIFYIDCLVTNRESERRAQGRIISTGSLNVDLVDTLQDTPNCFGSETQAQGKLKVKYLTLAALIHIS